MSTPPSASPAPPFWQPLLFGALAGGLGWGIRGQYGHETGAMIAGLLIGLVLLLLFRPQATSLTAARAAAWCTVAIGFGGSMTYGQTIGLTHDPDLIGNWAALRWGMLGLALKGGVWIGFAGAFLGLGLGGIRYRAAEFLVVMCGLLLLFAAGVWLFNLPYDPEHRVLPALYFSADWRWQPDAMALKPRREVWGGLFLALAGLVTYTGWRRRDALACRMALAGFVAGAVGFPLGQSLQACHAWNPEWFRHGLWAALGPHVNWWNMMETTFGATAGAGLGLGLWLNRRHIAPLAGPTALGLGLGWEWLLVGIHLLLLTAAEFDLWTVAAAYTEFSLVLGLIPVVAIAAGRGWPYLLILPITLWPIAGKTVRQLVYKEQVAAPWFGWLLYALLPLGLTTAAALHFTGRWQNPGNRFLRGTLLLSTWTYFGLNFAFFHFPWPWADWTSRTPNAIIFAVCALGLSALALRAPPGVRMRE